MVRRDGYATIGNPKWAELITNISKKGRMMRIFEASIFVAICVIFIATTIGVISSTFLRDDNVIEEIAEEIIEDQTGLEVDLTPSSLE